MGRKGIREMERFGQSDEESLKILQKLLAVNTCNPPGNEIFLIDVILSLLPQQTVKTQIIDHEGKRASLVVNVDGIDSRRCIGFAGHLDTVPTGRPEDWKYPPFAGMCEGAFCYGRGAADMRGGLTAMILLIRYYAAQDHKPPVDLRFFFTADEEASGIGAETLRKQGFFDNLSFLFICEPTGCAPGIAEKGAVWIDVEVRGKSAHAAIPFKGANALEAGFDFLHCVKRLVKQIPEHPLLGKSTCAVTRAAAGEKTNIVPDRAHFSVDVRLVPDAKYGNTWLFDAVQAKAQDFIKEHPQIAISLRLSNNRPALQSDKESHVFQHVFQTCCASTDAPKPCGIYFYTDASAIIPYVPIPFMILGPGEQSECHTVDEKIKISSIKDAFGMYARVIEAFAEM